MREWEIGIRPLFVVPSKLSADELAAVFWRALVSLD